jgi:hypothetical protein
MVEPIKQAPPPEPKPQPQKKGNPFRNYPAFVDLPDPKKNDTAILVGKPSRASLALITESDSLKLDGPRLAWGKKPVTVAGMRIGAAGVEFKWVAGAPDEAIAAVTNSLIELKAGGYSHRLALRLPEKVEAPKVDLKGARYRVVCKCKFPPPPESVRFDLIAAGQVATTKPLGLKLRDELTLQHGNGVTTTVRMKQTGAVLAAELTTQYQLPSGDIEALTVSRGNRVLRQLENLAAEAVAAPAEISRLSSYRSRMRSQYANAESISIGSRFPGGGYMENPALHAQKASMMAQAEREVVAATKRIAYLQDLSQNRHGIETDLGAIRQVAELAQSLKGTPLSHRFYTVVDGHEVDLIVAE